MTLIDLPTVRSLVETDLTDAALQMLVDDAEAEIVTRFGAHAESGAVVERFPGGVSSLYLSRPAATVTSVASIAADGSSTPVAITSYLVDAGLRVRTLAGVWPWTVDVTYTPVSDSPRRRRVLVDLVRLAVQYEAAQSTRLGDVSTGHVAYQQERDRLLAPLTRMVASFA